MFLYLEMFIINSLTILSPLLLCHTSLDLHEISQGCSSSLQDRVRQTEQVQHPSHEQSHEVNVNLTVLLEANVSYLFKDEEFSLYLQI